MINRIELKEKAKEVAFKNKWNILFPTLIYGVLLGIVSSILGVNKENPSNTASFIYFLIMYGTMFYTIGYQKYMLNMVRGESFEFKDILDYKSILVPAAILTFLVSAFTMLWTLLFIIPGIIAAYSYSQSMFIMAEDKDVKPLDAIKQSKELMNGHKMEYFVLQLSFIGWIILGSITFGIAFIWAVPYMQATYAMYFDELKKVN